MSSEPDSIAIRIAERRRTLGLSLAALASRAGLRAPSFLHHIEAGQKVPSESVAARLARALDDDEALYRAWARARRSGDLATTREALRTIEQHFSGLEARTAALESPAALVRIVLLPDGADPGTTAVRAGGVGETIRLDPRLLPGETLFLPFAYRLTERGARHATPTLSPGDLAILTRNAWPIQADAIYAVRIRGEVVLARARWSEGTLTVRGPDGADEETLPPTGTPPAALLGRVAVVIRAL